MFPNTPVIRGSRIRQDILEAHRRGIIIDIGHGFGGFAFKSARAMLAESIMPDVFSSELHVLCRDGPAHDVLAVMSKFMALGMPTTEVIRAATQNPACALRRPDLGGADTVRRAMPRSLKWPRAVFEHVDVSNEVIVAKTRLESQGMVLRGKWWAEGGNG